MKKRNLLLAILWMGMGACAKPSSSETGGMGAGEPTPHVDESYAQYGHLSWEQNKPVAKTWSQYVFSVLDKEAPDLINGSQDMEAFCPNYSRLLRSEKILFWGHLISRVARYESEFNPTLRFKESGTDAVTGQQLYSEGLLQLSYQDLQMMPKCEFSWSQDRALATTDPRKTIFSPYRNLRCGILILNRQVNRSDRIAMSSGAYWAVLKEDSAYSQLGAIRTFTRSLSICKR